MGATTLAPPGRSPSRDRRADLRRAATQVGLGVVPVGITAWFAYAALRAHGVAYDFHWSYYPAAHRLLHGQSPYAISARDVRLGAAFVYPALSAVVLAPFGLFDRALADHLYLFMCLLLVPATLWVAEVRDWRVYGIALVWFPVFVGWSVGNVSVPIGFLVVLAWRHRDRPWAAGLITAAAISLKPFVWPLAVWLLATRRWKAAGWALALGLVLNLLAWWIVGFGEIHAYLWLSGQETAAQWHHGYSLLALAHRFGLGRGAGDGLVLAAAVAGGLCVVRAGFFKRHDRQAMVLSVGLMLLASPLVWNHYFALLLVPVAISRPRLSAVWLAPLVMWFCPVSSALAGWQDALGWAVAAACLGSSLRAASGPTVAGRQLPPSGGSSKMATKEAGGRMLDWAMALARPDLAQKKSLPWLHPERQSCRVSASWPTTSMGSQPIVQDNESTDPPLSRDGKI